MGLLKLSEVKENNPDTSLYEHNDLIRNIKNDLVSSIGLENIHAMVLHDDSMHVREELVSALDNLCSKEPYIHLKPKDKLSLINGVIDEILGLGALQPLLDDPEITEIMVNGTHSFFYEKKGELFEANRVFASDEEILNLIERILSPLGRRIDERSPIVNARLSSGDRVHAVISPISLDGPILTIRKFSNRINSLDVLVSSGSISPSYAKLLVSCVRLRKNIAVVGATGSGKTTLLNALSCEIPESERIITIEDSAELQFKSHPHVVRLESRMASIEGMGEVTIRDLVKSALRMRPDRIVVGEVRGEEAIDMLQAMNTGHDGSLTTLHAGSAEEAISRLVLMARFGLDVPTAVIEGQIASALDVIVMVKRGKDGRRYVANASEVYIDSNGVLKAKPFVVFDEESCSWSLKYVPIWLSKESFVNELIR